MRGDRTRACAGMLGGMAAVSLEKQSEAALVGNGHIILTARFPRPAGLSREECSD